MLDALRRRLAALAASSFGVRAGDHAAHAAHVAGPSVGLAPGEHGRARGPRNEHADGGAGCGGLGAPADASTGGGEGDGDGSGGSDAGCGGSGSCGGGCGGGGD